MIIIFWLDIIWCVQWFNVNAIQFDMMHVVYTVRYKKGNIEEKKKLKAIIHAHTNVLRLAHEPHLNVSLLVTKCSRRMCLKYVFYFNGYSIFKKKNKREAIETKDTQTQNIECDMRVFCIFHETKNVKCYFVCFQ